MQKCLFLLLGLLAFMGFGCSPHPNSSKEIIDRNTTVNQLIQVYANLEQEAFDANLKKDQSFKIQVGIKNIAFARGWRFFRSEVNTNVTFKINPDTGQWLKSEESKESIALYCPILLKADGTNGVYGAVKYGGTVVYLKSFPVWTPIEIGN